MLVISESVHCSRGSLGNKETSMRISKVTVKDGKLLSTFLCSMLKHLVIQNVEEKYFPPM